MVSKTNVSPSAKKRILGTVGGAKRKRGISSSTPHFSGCEPLPVLLAENIFFVSYTLRNIWCINILVALFWVPFCRHRVIFERASTGCCNWYHPWSTPLVFSSRTTSYTIIVATKYLISYADGPLAPMNKGGSPFVDVPLFLRCKNHSKWYSIVYLALFLQHNICQIYPTKSPQGVCIIWNNWLIHHWAIDSICPHFRPE